MLHARLRYALTAQAQPVMYRRRRNEVRKILYWFFQKKMFVEGFGKALVVAHGKLLKINRRLVDRRAMRAGKHANINTYWERTVNKLRADMIANQDKSMADFVNNAGEIREEVKAACINRYL